MERSSSAKAAALIAATAAGPLFVAIFAGATLYSQLPHPILVSGQDVGLFILVLLLSMPFGFVISILPNLICATVMAAISDESELAREPAGWPLAGGAIVIGAIWFVDGRIDDAVDVAMILTGATCAHICRRFYAPPSSAQA